MPISLADHNPDSRFQILLDRQSALDIGAFVVDGVDLSPGDAIPSDGDRRIDRALPGFLFTCGPDHVRHPEPVEGADDGRLFPLHGSLCGTPVTSTAMSEDPARPGCSARTEVALADGGSAVVDRLWAVDPDGREVILTDRIGNTGETPFPPMLMYHINFGAWMFDAATRIEGAMLPAGGIPWRFGDGDTQVFCVPAGEGDAEGYASVSVGPIPEIGGRSVHIRFDTKTLPFLQIWRNQVGHANVLGIEPVSHRWVKRTELAQAGELVALQPGQSIDYALAFQVR
ncbi:DUF4432 family protein [Pararhizobium sp.]|uniref:DUF4432 family protein n=1 Tax=Pararhizobium sp. TaxID=1977563 RepID=UPI00271F76FF|nr:DUF4432 family protein [Pararhizobium sp.]MDO9414598.1 DUF4432 family protein [Pararhizobium sp.]